MPRFSYLSAAAALLTITLVLALGGVARAQQRQAEQFAVGQGASGGGGTQPAGQGAGWLENRARLEGPGIRAGDLEIHPGIGAEVGYDSNVFYAGDPATGAPVGTPTGAQGAAILRVTPHIAISTLGAARQAEGASGDDQVEVLPTLAFRGSLSASLYQIFLDRTSPNVSVDASLALTILPGRSFNISLSENFSRGVRPFATNLSMVSLDYSRNQNSAGVSLNFQSDGGVFRGAVGYNFGLDFFDGEQFRFANNLLHRFNGNVSWSFLPNTSLIYTVGVGYQSYLGSVASRSALVSNNVSINNTLGVNGAITDKLSLTVAVGYGAGFFESSQLSEYESLTANLEGRWTFSPTASLALGYSRGFNPSFVGGFSQSDRGYLRAQAIIDGSFVFGGEISGAYVSFGNLVGVTGMMLGNTLGREDAVLSGVLFGEYRFTEWFALNASFRYLGDFTGYRYNIVDTTGTIIAPAGFQKVEAWFGVRVFY